MRTVHHILLAAVTLLLLAIPVLAHHSFSSEFDANKKISIDGVISKVELINPHGYVHVDVKDPKTGKVTTWLFETHGPGQLRRMGLTRDVVGSTRLSMDMLPKTEAALLGEPSTSLMTGAPSGPIVPRRSRNEAPSRDEITPAWKGTGSITITECNLSSLSTVLRNYGRVIFPSSQRRARSASAIAQSRNTRSASAIARSRNTRSASAIARSRKSDQTGE